MTIVSLVSGTDRLTPSEIEELHIRLATRNSLNDTNINTEGIVSDILSGRSDPVPLYTSTSAGSPHDQIREQIEFADPDLWDSVFKVISNGQIEALDQFVKLGLDVTHIHPRRSQYPVFIAVKYMQTNMMRHLINIGADVNTWSAPVIQGYMVKYDQPDLERLRTPLMCAAEQGNLNICKILCESAFADPMLIAPDGQTAQRLAARNGHREIVQYLPAHRGGSLLRLKYDYNHRWRIIRVAVDGIYVFLKITFYKIPKFLIITLPWEILKETKRGIVRMYKAIPPIKEWPRIVKDAVVGMAKGIKKFLVALGRAIKATPKAIYNGGKYLAKQGKKLAIKTWRGIKALPRLMKIGLQKTWSGIKAIASWVKDLLLNILSLLHTVISAIVDFFRNITLADIIAGFKTVLRGIFIDFPKLLWTGLKVLGHGIHATLVYFFSTLYWIVYYIIYGLVWIVMYVPKRIGRIIMYIAGGIAQAFRELWVWISPKSMA